MTIAFVPFRRFALVAVATCVCASGALAASPGALTEAQARYRQDMVVCQSGQSNQDRATCRLEAKNALAAAKRGALNDAPGQYQQNALQRCSAHKDEDRRACEARMTGQGSTEGSAAAGGVLRQSVTVTPAN